MKQRLKLLFLLFFFLWSGSVGGHADEQQEKSSFEVLHLWATDAEQRALAVIRHSVEARGVIWKEQYVRTNFRGVRDTYSQRVALGIPPSAVFWIGDRELRKFIKNGTMRLIPEPTAGPSFSEILRPEVYEVVRTEGGISSVPIGIHVQNNALYNLQHLKAVNRPIPSSWSEYLKTAKLLQRAGFVPLSISSESWQMRPLILSIFAEGMGPDEFADYFGSDVNYKKLKTKLLEAFAVLGELRKYSNKNYHNLAWESAVFLVRDNIATANFLGDFNSPMIDENKDIICSAPPGNNVIIWSFDVAAFSEITDTKGQEVFAEVSLSKETNRAFVEAKGGLPVLSNVATGGFNRCSKSTIERWDNTEHKFHLAGGVWLQQLNIIANAAKSFWESSSKFPDLYVDEIIQSLEILD